ncbi:MAG: hypothetical protein PHG64_14225 [Paludibacter sp.]|nr:hypothetical protein [Paludibacter sp.]
MAEQQPLQLNLQKGTLSESLGIKPEDEIPIALLTAILNTKIPDGQDSVSIMNPTLAGNNVIEVTALMKKRANFAKVAKQKWGMGN